MPKTLLDRLQPDSIREFRAAARHRYDDGLAAAASGRRTAAIYLWGYAAEMILKAAYFAANGQPPSASIGASDLKAARNLSMNRFGIVWPEGGKYHNIEAWSELLVAYRSSSSRLAYTEPGFGDQIKRRGRSLGKLWWETLRYHKNLAHVYEVEQSRAAADWFLSHVGDL